MDGCPTRRFEDLDLLSARYSKRIARDALPASLAAHWAEIKGRDVVVLPSKGELLAAHQIEAHYDKASQAVEAKLSAWRAAAERGRVVSGFGDAAARLYTSTLAAFDKATQPYAASPLRVQRHRALQGALRQGIQELVRRQLANLQQQGLKRFKGALLQHVGLEDREDRENASQRALEEWFGAQAERVVVPAVPGAGAFERALSDFVDQLTEYAHKWPQSPGYNVAAMKKLEGGARKKKGSGGKASWGATFQLVSLLRTPGDGALQGFATYQVGSVAWLLSRARAHPYAYGSWSEDRPTGHSFVIHRTHTCTRTRNPRLALTCTNKQAGPVQFLMGLQNDRDLPESRIEGKAPPLLRIQPKVAFDVDL